MNSKGDPYTVQDLDEIFASQELQLHPGTDCFVIKKSILEKVDMGNLFLGTSPFANMLLLQTSYFAKKVRKFGSFELNATYHLGNERIWRRDESLIRLTIQNINNAISDLRSWIDLCSEEARSHKDTGREKSMQYCIDLIIKLEKYGDKENPLYVVQKRNVHSCQTGYSMITQVNSCVTSAKFLAMEYDDEDENYDDNDSESNYEGLSGEDFNNDENNSTESNGAEGESNGEDDLDDYESNSTESNSTDDESSGEDEYDDKDERYDDKDSTSTDEGLSGKRRLNNYESNNTESNSADGKSSGEDDPYDYESNITKSNSTDDESSGDDDYYDDGYESIRTCFASNVNWKGEINKLEFPSIVLFGFNHFSYAGWICKRDSLPRWLRPPTDKPTFFTNISTS